MPNPPAMYPAAFAATNVMAYASPDNTAQVVTPATPMPVTVTTVDPLPVAVAALPLPGGAATAANQAVEAATLAAIAGQLPASLGARALAQSLSVAIATDLANLEPGGSAVSGTAMPGGGTGLTGWLSAIYRASTENAAATGSVTSAASVVSASNALNMGGSFQVTAAGTGCTVSYEQSNDNTNWVSLPVIAATAANSAAVTTSSAAGLYAYTSAAAFVRARVSTYGSGTVTVVLCQKRQATPTTGVSLAAGSSALGSVTVSGTINNGAGYTDSTTALTAAAVFTGTGRNNSASQYAFFNATAFADQAGTLFVDQSLDSGATWQAVASQAVAANGAANLSVRIAGAYSTATLYRVRYVNGATAQVTFRLSSSFTAS